jgi:Raf kinase inhibitor-like YbhB/YbcL family protein
MAAVKRSLKYAAIVLSALIGVFLIAFMVLRARGHADIADGQATIPLRVKSSSYADGGLIPKRFTCAAEGLSPAIEFGPPPSGTKSFAMVMDDADSPFGFVHWLVYNIPSQTQAIAEGASSQKALPRGAIEGVGSDDTARYAGPCPPGNKAHRYVMRVYALSLGGDLKPGMTKQELAVAVKGHVLAEGRWAGLFGAQGD